MILLEHEALVILIHLLHWNSTACPVDDDTLTRRAYCGYFAQRRSACLGRAFGEFAVADFGAHAGALPFQRRAAAEQGNAEQRQNQAA